MKRILLAGASLFALAGLTGAATAADLGRPITKAPPPVVAPIYNWTGLYIGINGGGGWGNSSWSSSHPGDFDVSGGLIGGTIGYNWQSGPWVLGLEGDIDWSNIKGSALDLWGAPIETKNEWLATLRGRVGYAFDRFLPYVTGGAAFGDVKGTSVVTSKTDTRAGWTVGGGVEFALMPNLSAKIEYLYVDLGDFDCSVCSGVSPDDVKFTTNIVRGGLNYRF